MSILLQAISPRHERRIRLVFTAPLAIGAFGNSPTFYRVVNQDGKGVSPVVNASLLVSGSPNVAELALGDDLVQGALYKVFAEGVPAADASTTPVGSYESLRFGAAVVKTDVEPAVKERDDVLYGVDLVWNGADFQESANGDLDRVGGTPNVSKALHRGVTAEGLPWDNTYGAKAREFVDSPSGAIGTLQGSVKGQILKDPRVKSVKTDIDFTNSSSYIHASVTLHSGEELAQVSLQVPNGT